MFILLTISALEQSIFFNCILSLYEGAIYLICVMVITQIGYFKQNRKRKLQPPWPIPSRMLSGNLRSALMPRTALVSSAKSMTPQAKWCLVEVRARRVLRERAIVHRTHYVRRRQKKNKKRIKNIAMVTDAILSSIKGNSGQLCVQLAYVKG